MAFLYMHIMHWRGSITSMLYGGTWSRCCQVKPVLITDTKGREHGAKKPKQSRMNWEDCRETAVWDWVLLRAEREKNKNDK